MRTKTQSIVIAVSLIFGFVGLAMDYSGPTGWSRLLLMGFDLAYITALIMLTQNGHFIHSNDFKKAQFCFSIVIVGALFKLMHWPFGDALACMGLGGIAFFYVIWFLKKPYKRGLDILKMIWVVSAYIFAVLRLLHLIDPDWITATDILFWLMFAAYANEEYQKQKLKNPPTESRMNE